MKSNFLPPTHALLRKSFYYHLFVLPRHNYICYATIQCFTDAMQIATNSAANFLHNGCPLTFGSIALFLVLAPLQVEK